MQCTKRRRKRVGTMRKHEDEEDNEGRRDEMHRVQQATAQRTGVRDTMTQERGRRSAASGWPMRRAGARRCSGVPPRTASARQEDCAGTGPGGHPGAETSRRHPGGTLAPLGSPSGCMALGNVAYLCVNALVSPTQSQYRPVPRTLDDTRELVVLVEIEQFLLWCLRRRPVRRVALAAERDVREVET